MFEATLRGTVLAVTPRTSQAGKTYADIYILQPGSGQLVQAYSDVEKLGGIEALPERDSVIEAECFVFAGNDRGGRVSVRVDRWGHAAAPAAARAA